MENDFTSWKFAAGLFVAGSLAGVAALLRSNAQITRRVLLSAVLNSGIFSAVIGLLMWSYFEGKHPEAIAGFSLLGGLGGNTALGVVLKAFYPRLSRIVEVLFEIRPSDRPSDKDAPPHD